MFFINIFLRVFIYMEVTLPYTGHGDCMVIQWPQCH